MMKFHRRKQQIWVGVMVLAIALSVSRAATIHVPGDQGTIQAGIDAAISGVDEVVVAPGTYLEAINFNGKAITVRSASGNASDTIIDGTGNFHVVQCDNNEGPDSVLEGFTITGGNADGAGFPDNNGGGMLINNSSPTVRRCVFHGNSANSNGGGIFATIYFGTVSHCRFVGNSAAVGGGMLNFSGRPTVTHCTFTGNTAGSNGGGIYNFQEDSTVSHCTFSGNTAGFTGGGIYNFETGPLVTNSVFWANSDAGGMDESAQIHTDNGFTVVTYSIVQGGWSGTGGTGNLSSNPLFVDADGADNTAGTEDDNLRLTAASPAIDAGNNAGVPAGIVTDLDGDRRFIDDPNAADTSGPCPVSPVDMGAYEFQASEIDSDNDTILDVCDLCPGFDDLIDTDADTVADGCDACPGFDDAGPDTDGDGVVFGCDRCEGFDDSGPDSDNDGNPDACDDCILPADINCDGMVDLVDQALLALHWLETI
jgi:predicted outer membrane repeat protein